MRSLNLFATGLVLARHSQPKGETSTDYLETLILHKSVVFTRQAINTANETEQLVGMISFKIFLPFKGVLQG